MKGPVFLLRPLIGRKALPDGSDDVSVNVHKNLHHGQHESRIGLMRR